MKKIIFLMSLCISWNTMAQNCNTDLFNDNSFVNYSELEKLGLTKTRENIELQGTPKTLAEIIVGIEGKFSDNYSCSAISIDLWEKSGDQDTKYLVIFTTEDDCDGGNTLGNLIKVQGVKSSGYSRYLDSKVIGSIGDSDMSCVKNFKTSKMLLNRFYLELEASEII